MLKIHQSSIKKQLLVLIPLKKSRLIHALNNAEDNKFTLAKIIISEFGFNKSKWEEWQFTVEQLFIDTPDPIVKIQDPHIVSISDWLDGAVGKKFDTDELYGTQCKDLANAYANWLGHPLQPSNAVDTWHINQDPYWQKQPYAKDFLLQTGDIVVWDSWNDNIYGHVAIVIDSSNNSFRTVDQNWNNPNSETGSPASIVTHNFNNPPILGYLRPTL